MWNQACWIKLPQDEIEEKKIYHGDMTGRFAYFRCETEIPANASLTVDITASSRYRLWVNEKPVLSGPCKGDTFRQYYETVDLTAFLQPGKNVFCVQVLYCDPDTAEIQTDERASIYGVIGPKAGHHLAVEGDIFDDHGECIGSITTGTALWRVWLDGSFYLKSSEITCYLGAVEEEIDVSASPFGWKERDFDCSLWKAAKNGESVKSVSVLNLLVGVQQRFRMREREIPLLYEETGHFAEEFTLPEGTSSGLMKKGSLVIPAGTSKEIVLDAGYIQNGYPAFSFLGGQGSRIEIIYFEKFGGPGSDLPRKDYKNGEVKGRTDRLLLDGGSITFEPFWVCTFRFISVRVRAEQDVTMYMPSFRKTGYPLQAESEIHSDVPWVDRLWEICVRTLGNCMLETYMDCPYYEQLQFAMDTRLEALFTYTVTKDAALARKALIDFHYGMQPEGLTAGKYPSVYLQILSTFSLHYVFMLWEYYKQTADMETIRTCRGDVDRILDYYDRRIGQDGLVGRLEFWEFVDWVPEWGESGGTPQALQQGPSTIINLMYACALGCGELLFRASGREGLAEEYAARRRKILRAIQNLCWDLEKKMYREGPSYSQFSRHAQAWAVLNGLKEGSDAKDLLTRAMQDEKCLVCTFSTSYEWFRALEKAGMYKEMRESLDPWISLLELDCTTCPETPVQARSDCHAWSALPMYEMIRTIAGIRPDEIGGRHVRIEPHMMDLTKVHGKAATPCGPIGFCYEKTSEGMKYELEIPKGIQAVFCAEDGRTKTLEGGKKHSFVWDAGIKEAE